MKQTIKCVKIAEEIPFNGGQMVNVLRRLQKTSHLIFFGQIEVGSLLFIQPDT